MVSEDQRWKEKRLHLSVQQPCKFILTKESVYIRKEFNSHRTGLVLKHGRRPFIVSQHQYELIRLPWCRHVYTLYTLLWCVICFLIVRIHYYFKPSNKRNEKYWHSHIFLFYFFFTKFVQFVQNQNIAKTRLVFPTKARNAEILSRGFNDIECIDYSLIFYFPVSSFFGQPCRESRRSGLLIVRRSQEN